MPANLIIFDEVATFSIPNVTSIGSCWPTYTPGVFYERSTNSFIEAISGRRISGCPFNFSTIPPYYGQFPAWVDKHGTWAHSMTYPTIYAYEIMNRGEAYKKRLYVAGAPVGEFAPKIIFADSTGFYYSVFEYPSSGNFYCRPWKFEFESRTLFPLCDVSASIYYLNDYRIMGDRSLWYSQNFASGQTPATGAREIQGFNLFKYDAQFSKSWGWISDKSPYYDIFPSFTAGGQFDYMFECPRSGSFIDPSGLLYGGLLNEREAIFYSPDFGFVHPIFPYAKSIHGTVRSNLSVLCGGILPGGLPYLIVADPNNGGDYSLYVPAQRGGRRLINDPGYKFFEFIHKTGLYNLARPISIIGAYKS